MKNTVQSKIRGGLLAVGVGIGLVLGGSSAMAADVTQDDGELVIQGVVEVYTAISVDDKPAADLGILAYNAGVTKVSVATVTELCNKEDGYDVTIQSLNRAGDTANLKNTSGDAIPYSIYYNGSVEAVDMAGAAAVNITNASLPTDSDGVDKDVQIEIASGYKISGSYSDTLTFTITAK